MRTIEFTPAELRRRKRNAVTVASLLALIVLAFILSMNTGFIRLSPLDLLRTLFGSGTDQQHLILFDFRLPRIVISLLIGAGLAVSGSVLQAISRNALADPGILGINAGAGLAVLVFVAFYSSAASAPAYLLPILAWAGAGVAALLVFMISYRKHTGLSSNRLLMNGIAINSGISALTIVISLRLNPDQFQFVSTWMAGSIWGKDWSFVTALLPFIVVLLPYVFYKAHTVNVLSLGNSMATGLGAFVNREQVLLLAAAVGLAGSCVAVSGSIGFVGLITPHLARRLVGSRFQILLPATALAGALLVLVADTLGRWVLQPSEIPAGLVVAVIGAPYFLYLLVRSRS
ncbi:FecCD family ABC transporter permease [Paenibacillus glycinis]|uniref:Iron chelate uptake ABC transporter family permease subunit n=1 Tax=Paenibacillus glycinis TaxID=2697035 RepID=A0ABW9XWP1_9BACL|nr:iron ABC transporter permease [Paenibacillus glycinis]NBD27122.1 iron chelate uptake ABC transporter family permease subunit [Paenibacillus glycinis]